MAALPAPGFTATETGRTGDGSLTTRPRTVSGRVVMVPVPGPSHRA